MPNSEKPDEAKSTHHVYLEIQVKPKNRGFHYIGIAKPEGMKPIRVEGYASGSQKEVERVVQNRISKILEAQKKVMALKTEKEMSPIDTPIALPIVEVQIPETPQRVQIPMTIPTISYSITANESPQSEKTSQPTIRYTITPNKPSKT